MNVFNFYGDQRFTFGPHICESFWCNFVTRPLKTSYSLEPLQSLNPALLLRDLFKILRE